MKVRIRNSANKDKIRTISITEEFDAFYKKADNRTKTKIEEVFDAIETLRIITANYAEKLQNSEFYEFKIRVGNNPYRSIVFIIDGENLQVAKNVLVLNCFLKKSNNDYTKYIKRARNILNSLEHEND